MKLIYSMKLKIILFINRECLKIVSCMLFLLSVWLSSCITVFNANQGPNKQFGMPDTQPLQANFHHIPNGIIKPNISSIDLGNIVNMEFAHGKHVLDDVKRILDINVTTYDDENDIKLYLEAASWVGTPYKHAGNSKSGTDCSGLSYAIFKTLYAKNLDRTSDGQYFKNCKRINKSELKPGDLVFFKINGNKISHVGIYLKDNKFIHASSHRGVVVNDLDEKYYLKYYYASGRVK